MNCLLQLKELMYFGVVACVFLFAYGVAMQSLLYPNSEREWWSILYSVFSRPYLSIFEEFDLDELAGVFRVRYLGACSAFVTFVLRMYRPTGKV